MQGPIVLSYVQRIFLGGAKHFLEWVSPPCAPLVTDLQETLSYDLLVDMTDVCLRRWTLYAQLKPKFVF